VTVLNCLLDIFKLVAYRLRPVKWYFQVNAPSWRKSTEIKSLPWVMVLMKELYQSFLGNGYQGSQILEGLEVPGNCILDPMIAC
jgi:hypothetical protein